MKKIIIRAGVLLVIFICGVAGFSSLMNHQSTDNRTDMETASSPSMAMMLDGTEINRMYAYADQMDVSSMRDSITPLGTDRTLEVCITPNGREIKSLLYEVTTPDGEEVVENNKIRNFNQQDNGTLTLEFTLTQPILMDQEYALNFTLNTEDGSWHYYTRLLQRAGLSTKQYVDFVNSFSAKTILLALPSLGCFLLVYSGYASSINQLTTESIYSARSCPYFSVTASKILLLITPLE